MKWLYNSTIFCLLIISHGSTDAQFSIINGRLISRIVTRIKNINPSLINMFKDVAMGLIADAIFLALEVPFNRMRAGAFGNTSRALFNQAPGPVPLGRGMIAPGTVPKDINDIIYLINHPEKLAQAHAHMWNGILLTGSPGTGKSDLGFYISRETGCNVLYEAASGLIAPGQGSGAASVRALFDRAYKKPLWTRIKNTCKSMLLRILGRRRAIDKPVVLIIDEIDAIGQSRQMQIDKADRAREGERVRTLEQLLTEIDFVNQSKRVLPHIFVVGTSNTRPEAMDPALVRAGRLRPIIIQALNDNLRKEVLEFHAKQYRNIDQNVDFVTISRETEGWSGAELRNLVNEAVLLANREGQSGNPVTHEHFEQALNALSRGRHRV
jgi:cell division protease FtsH